MAKKMTVKLVNVPTKTKKPTGLKISRSGYNTFVCEWKLGATYISQKFAYTTHGASKYRPYTYLNVTKGQVKKTITIDRTEFYPEGNALCKAIMVAVQGQAQHYMTKTKKYTLTPSDWEYKEIILYPPKKPSVSTSLSETYTNVCTFSWSVNSSGNDSLYVFHDVLIQTVLVKEGKEIDWSNATEYSRGASGSISITEDTALLANASYTRYFRVMSRGMAGHSDWNTVKHVYARPKQAKIDTSTLTANITEAGGFQCYCRWTASSDADHPIDQTSIQYCITIPDAGLSCPDGASWNDAGVINDTKNYDAATFSIDGLLSEDQCLFVRVNTKHDTNVTYGLPALASVGKLKMPSAPDVSISTATHNATIECDNNSDVPDSFIAIEFQMGDEPVWDIGIIPHNETSITVQCPDWGDKPIAFIARAVVGNYRRVERADGADAYVVTPNHLFESNRTSYESGSIPTAPTNVLAVPTLNTGTVRISWDWSWSGARAAELSWADHDDAWESTDEPDTYVVSNLNASRWNVAGLATGKRWFFRVRLMSSEDDANYSPYSDIVYVDLSSTPAIPSLSLSKGVITEDEGVTASWSYTTEEAYQEYAEICDIADPAQTSNEYILTTDTSVKNKDYYIRGGSGTSESPYAYNIIDLAEYELTQDASLVDGKIYYERSGEGTSASPYVYVIVSEPESINNLYERSGSSESNPSQMGLYELERKIIAHVESAQSITIYPSEVGWSAGETHYLAVRAKGATGQITEEWSDYKSVAVAVPLTCEITATSLESATTEEQETELQLTELPLSVTVEGAGDVNTTIIVIERAESYILDRPDENRFTGYEGEMVVSREQIGETEIIFTREDIEPQHFDDGARYRITATVKDSIGQVANAEPVEFTVRWAEQAIMPEAWAVVDTQYDAVVIGIETPTGASQDATCDIYRLSSDKPELIYEGAPLGSKIVDPYPAIGESGGHRIVYKTVNGDYITEQNMMAWIDLHEDEDDILDVEYAIIDFEGGHIRLYHNLDLSQSWDKDFKETAYLGGSVQGDWNPAISRTSSLSTTVIRLTESDIIMQMRRLAVSPTECHIRTPDGSSYAADIQVSESSGTETRNLIYDYSLKITRIDTERLDGLTLEEWQAQHEE